MSEAASENGKNGRASAPAADSLDGGFKEPVFAAQAVFHALMSAMARPGTIHRLDGFVLPPAPVNAPAGAVVATLCDPETLLWLDPTLSLESAAGGWFSFHTGTKLTNDLEAATFALALSAKTMPTLAVMEQGTSEYPDRSTTLILQVERLFEGGDLLLEGPGIETTIRLGVATLPAFFREAWAENNQRFPRGVDLIFASPAAIACLPRTTRINTGKR